MNGSSIHENKAGISTLTKFVKNERVTRQRVKKGIQIEILSILWMFVEASIAVGAGIAAHSLALMAFGMDSVIELIAGFVLLWRLYVEARGTTLERIKRVETIASWVVGISLLSLAIYIVLSAVHNLWLHQGAESTLIGIGLAIASGILMPILAKTKREIGDQIGSKALKADGSCSIICAYMAWTLIVGVLFTALIGWWWIDSLIALALVYFVVKEGLEAIQEAKGLIPDT